MNEIPTKNIIESFIACKRLRLMFFEELDCGAGMLTIHGNVNYITYTDNLTGTRTLDKDVVRKVALETIEKATELERIILFE